MKTCARWPGGVAGDADRRGAGLTARGSALMWILALAVLVRVALLLALGDLPLRADEVEYQGIAVNLAEGRGFALNDRLTSWRPPLYPFALAAIYRLTGTTDPVAARVLQVVFSSATVLVVYLLGRRLFGTATGLWAAALFAVYPSLLFYNAHLLTEVLFTFLVTLTMYAFSLHVEQPRLRSACAVGLCLGLAALGRDVILPLALPLALLVAWPTRRRWGRATLHAAGFVLAVVAVVGPWMARNTMLQGTLTSIATNGGPSILAGNNPHTPLDRPWKYHDFALEQRWRSLVPPGVTEGERQRIAVRLVLQHMREYPALTLQRAVIKAANVWGLERDIVGTILAGHYGAVRPGLVILVTAIIFGAYMATLLVGLAGLVFAVRAGGDRSFHVLFIILIAFVTAVHAIAFGHPRYHLPLMPLFCTYAAYAGSIRATIWGARRSPAFLATGALAALALAIWTREILFIELQGFLRALKHL